MSGDRRYSDDEVKEILRRATDQSPEGAGALGQDGLTLRELQEIGAEVGIPPATLERAALSLDRVSPPAERSSLPIPLTVSRTQVLPRDLTDLEWERLVGELRETFRARGKVERLGRLRQWTNGNLYVLLEPAEEGYRLRMGSKKGDVQQLMTAGGVMVLFSSLLLVLSLLGVGGEPERFVRAMSILGPIGLGLIGAGAVQLPGWARTRRAQMDAIAEQVARVAALPPADSSPDQDADPS